MSDVLEVYVQTGQRGVRDFTPEEAAQRAVDLDAAHAAEAERIAAEEAKAAARASAIAKLAALGLTAEEAAALIGQ